MISDICYYSKLFARTSYIGVLLYCFSAKATLLLSRDERSRTEIPFASFSISSSPPPPPQASLAPSHQQRCAKWKLSWNMCTYTLRTLFARLVPTCMLNWHFLTKLQHWKFITRPLLVGLPPSLFSLFLTCWVIMALIYQRDMRRREWVGEERRCYNISYLFAFSPPPFFWNKKLERWG